MRFEPLHGCENIHPRRRVVLVPAGAAHARDRFTESLDHRIQMSPRFPAGKSSANGAAARVPQHYDETDTEMQDRILDTAYPDRSQDIARSPYDEEIAAFVDKRNYTAWWSSRTPPQCLAT